MTLVAIPAVAALSVVLVAAGAQAQTKKRGIANRTGTQVVVRTRAPTRITVIRRSFLDPGKESQTFDRHYHDYALPPTHSTFYDRNDWKGSFSRMPLPGPFDLPGYRNF